MGGSKLGRYKEVPPGSGNYMTIQSYYEDYKRCTPCGCYIQYDGNFCPCCGCKLRVRANNKKYRVLGMMLRGVKRI
jgi:hypothetical protein